MTLPQPAWQRRAYNVATLRDLARATLPKPIFDFADGGAEDEHTLRRNAAAFGEIELLPCPLRGAATRDLSISLFGKRLNLPLIIGPTGLAGLFWPDGERCAQRAANAAGIGFCLSHGSVCKLEDLVAGAGPRWMQVFVYKDRGFTRELAQRAANCGYDALVLTIDNQLLGNRERDNRNGFAIPPRFGAAEMAGMALKVPWLWRMRREFKRITFGNYARPGEVATVEKLAGRMASLLDPSMSWKDVDILRKDWTGPLILKGVLHPSEAKEALAHGIDGVIVSNHGGRQLDGAVASIAALPGVVEAVSGRIPVLVDGGVRRGGDIVKALALGASACLIARPQLWGLAVAGEAGVSHVIDIYRRELDRAMGLCGMASIGDIGKDLIFSRGLAPIMIERIAKADLDRLVRERWKAQADYVNAHSEFYRHHKFSGRIEELADTPFTDKEMLREDQRLNPPFGSYLASSPTAVSRIHRTSGSTGTAMNIALSASDARLWAEVGARAMRLCGLGPGHRVVHCLNYQMWMGGYTDHAVLEATGAAVVPFGVGGSERLIPVIRDLGITAIHCTPSYPAVLERVIAEHFPGMKPRDLGLKLGLFGGEAGLDQPAFRKRLEETWGFAVRNANYGVSDMLTIIAGQSEHTEDLHFVAGDVLYPELIEAETGRPKPFRAGETGELVLTHLKRDCQPLVRFRTGDVITVADTVPTPQGVTAPRFRVVGRADDMIVVRGLNMFPAMVQGIVNQFPHLSGEYRIVLDTEPPYDALPLQVELVERAPRDGLAELVEAAIKKQLGGTAHVTVLEPNSLPRSEGKIRRVVRNY